MAGWSLLPMSSEGLITAAHFNELRAAISEKATALGAAGYIPAAVSSGDLLTSTLLSNYRAAALDLLNLFSEKTGSGSEDISFVAIGSANDILTEVFGSAAWPNAGASVIRAQDLNDIRLVVNWYGDQGFWVRPVAGSRGVPVSCKRATDGSTITDWADGWSQAVEDVFDGIAADIYTATGSNLDYVGRRFNARTWGSPYEEYRCNWGSLPGESYANHNKWTDTFGAQVNVTASGLFLNREKNVGYDSTYKELGPLTWKLDMAGTDVITRTTGTSDDRDDVFLTQSAVTGNMTAISYELYTDVDPANTTDWEDWSPAAPAGYGHYYVTSQMIWFDSYGCWYQIQWDYET